MPPYVLTDKSGNIISVYETYSEAQKAERELAEREEKREKTKADIRRVAFYHDGPAQDDDGEYLDAEEAFELIDRLEAKIAWLEKQLARCNSDWLSSQD